MFSASHIIIIGDTNVSFIFKVLRFAQRVPIKSDKYPKETASVTTAKISTLKP
jgi:hypothetical protein